MITKQRALEAIYNLYEANGYEDAKWLAQDIAECDEDEDIDDNSEIIFEMMALVLDKIKEIQV